MKPWHRYSCLCAVVALLILVALPATAAEKWFEAYNRGVDLVRAQKFQPGAQALQRAVQEVPEENAAARVRDQIFTYTPHFWLGIARLNEFIIADALRDGRLVRLLEDFQPDEGLAMRVIYTPERHRLPRVAAMVDFLVSSFASRPWRAEPKKKKGGAKRSSRLPRD